MVTNCVCFQPHDWEPTIINPFRGIVTWTSPECLEFTTTLFKEARADEFEDKEWVLTVEEVGGASDAACSYICRGACPDFHLAFFVIRLSSWADDAPWHPSTSTSKASLISWERNRSMPRSNSSPCRAKCSRLRSI